MKFNKEKEMLYIQGKLVKLTHEPLITYVNGKKKTGDEPLYQFAVVAPEDEPIADQIRALYYADAAEQFIPKWIKGEVEQDENANIFYNFKSRYDIRYFVAEEDGKAYNFETLKEEHGSIIGSDVTLAVKCKEGALYVSAMRIDHLKSVTVDDFFA